MQAGGAGGALACPAAARALRLLRETPLARALPPSEAAHPASVALAALVGTQSLPLAAQGACGNLAKIRPGMQSSTAMHPQQEELHVNEKSRM